MSNYVTKSDFKKATGFVASNFLEKVDLASLKLDIDKLDIDKLVKVPSGWSKLKRKVDNLDVDKFVPAPIELIKLSDAILKMMLLNRQNMMNCTKKLTPLTLVDLIQIMILKSIRLKAKYVVLLA